jgi:pimeloyl-ACP methyl ester carboxylesterase
MEYQKTSFYWYRIIPLLTPHFTIIAPDIRGFGDSAKPHSGYDMKTIAEDLAQLMTALGHGTFYAAGEDWGAAFAYALAASNRERVKKLSFGEMLLPGFGIEKWSFLNEENVNSPHWSWHVNFFFLRDVPEMLIQGREEIFKIKGAHFKPGFNNTFTLTDPPYERWSHSVWNPDKKSPYLSAILLSRIHFFHESQSTSWSDRAPTSDCGANTIGAAIF